MRSYLFGGIVFVALNILDALFTRMALSRGAVEVMPLARLFGSNLLLKGLIAVAVVALLVLFRWSKLLWLLNIGMGAVVVWGGLVVLL
jgi:hypothetical protein